MKPNYKNWVPKGMIFGFASASIITLFVYLLVYFCITNENSTLFCIILGSLTLILIFATIWLYYMYRTFSYEGKRQLAKIIVEGTAEYVKIIDGGKILDVGCGSGALTIAVAKRNPKSQVIGIDKWGKEYASFNKRLCEENAKAEGVNNVTFAHGNAIHLEFEDETFDAVTSNYVYHNIVGANKQECLKETLRVLKKGGVFAIHDIMSKGRYGNMEIFAQQLRQAGYEKVELIDTTNGLFMNKKEAILLELKGSTLLVGKK